MTILRFSSADRRQEFGGAVFVQAVDPKLLPALFSATRCESCWSLRWSRRFTPLSLLWLDPLKLGLNFIVNFIVFNKKRVRRKSWVEVLGFYFGWSGSECKIPKYTHRGLKIPVNEFNCLLSMLFLGMWSSSPHPFSVPETIHPFWAVERRRLPLHLAILQHAKV